MTYGRQALRVIQTLAKPPAKLGTGETATIGSRRVQGYSRLSFSFSVSDCSSLAQLATLASVCFAPDIDSGAALSPSRLG